MLLPYFEATGCEIGFVSNQVDIIDNCTNIIKNKVCIILDKLACMPTPITKPTTITVSGYYCLANNLTTGGITIASNAVVVDLNNYNIMLPGGGAAVASDGDNRISIRNGNLCADVPLSIQN